ncbi:unnamed protein product [Paramecium pentaurelia]|uniref:Uncharacterized protein n=1 Tax=Paramecium pentaurelia TaxID=43138 RepID=A0A8S1UJX5_9CILI|nr:unnamed protein product [Paramecium pentaurelia]
MNFSLDEMRKEQIEDMKKVRSIKKQIQHDIEKLKSEIQLKITFEYSKNKIQKMFWKEKKKDYKRKQFQEEKHINKEYQIFYKIVNNYRDYNHNRFYSRQSARFKKYKEFS